MRYREYGYFFWKLIEVKFPVLPNILWEPFHNVHVIHTMICFFSWVLEYYYNMQIQPSYILLLFITEE